jgi:hypothetical protein
MYRICGKGGQRWAEIREMSGTSEVISRFQPDGLVEAAPAVRTWKAVERSTRGETLAVPGADSSSPKSEKSALPEFLYPRSPRCGWILARPHLFLSGGCWHKMSGNGGSANGRAATNGGLQPATTLCMPRGINSPPAYAHLPPSFTEEYRSGRGRLHECSNMTEIIIWFHRSSHFQLPHFTHLLHGKC